MSRQEAIPEELFHAIATLVARFVFVANAELGVPPFELLTLWHIRHVGKLYGMNQRIVLRRELTRMLTQKFRFSDVDVTRLVKDLHRLGLIQPTQITADERRNLFGSGKGQTQTVVLTQKGNEKIEEFKQLLRSRAEEWIGKTRGARLAIRTLQPLAVKFARWLVRRYEPERERMLFSEIR